VIADGSGHPLSAVVHPRCVCLELTMKITKAIFIAGVVVGAVLLVRSRRSAVSPDFEKTTNDLQPEDLSFSKVVAHGLVDINIADASQLLDLGLPREAVDRLIENRPYRNKMELVSRMVLTEELYTTVRDRVAVAEAHSPIKVA
jgi:hypothetical protein